MTLAGQPLRIGGTMGYGFAFGRTEEEFTSSPEDLFLKAFENTEPVSYTHLDLYKRQLSFRGLC